jgi:hypothetical protein
MWGLEPVLDQCKNLHFAGNELATASGFDLGLSSFHPQQGLLWCETLSKHDSFFGL